MKEMTLYITFFSPIQVSFLSLLPSVPSLPLVPLSLLKLCSCSNNKLQGSRKIKNNFIHPKMNKTLIQIKYHKMFVYLSREE